MAEPSVDLLEVINIDHHERERLVLSSRVTDKPTRNFIKRPTVIDFGERIGEGLLLGELLLEAG